MSEFLPATEGSAFSDFSYLINNNFYDFKVFLGSFDGRLKRIGPSSIKMLCIEDTLDNPYHSGYIVLDNRQDNLESSFDSSISQEDPQYYIPPPRNSRIEQAYMFNGDSRDILSVQIMPKLTDQGNNTSDDNVLKYFFLKFDFAIYNTEEIGDGNMDNKLKKLYFWELDYEILREKNSYFATSNYINNVDKDNIQNLNNEERSITTGIALSAALVESLEPDTGLKLAFDAFDTGSTSIFFSAPGDFKCIDTINYILDRHVSSASTNYSPCILQLERYPKQYSLRSLHDLFQNAIKHTGNSLIAGSEYLETYKIAGYSNVNSLLPTFDVVFTPPYAPYLTTEGNLDVYSFDSVAGLYTQPEINSKIVHFYDYNNKEFDIDAERNSIANFSTAANKSYITPFASQGTSTFQLGNFRQKNKNTSNEFATVELDKNQRLSLGLAQNLKNYVFLNNFVTFKVQGATYRQAGKFIGINRENNKQPTLFDNKFLGVYLITGVKHIFEDAKYTNELVCVKTYIPQDIFLNKNIP